VEGARSATGSAPGTAAEVNGGQPIGRNKSSCVCCAASRWTPFRARFRYRYTARRMARACLGRYRCWPQGARERSAGGKAWRGDPAHWRAGHGNELLRKDGRPDTFGQPEVVEMSRTISAGIGKPMGWSESVGCSDCRVRRSMPLVRASRATWCHSRRQRRGPKPKMPDADLLNAIRADLAASRLSARAPQGMGALAYPARHPRLAHPCAASDAGERFVVAASSAPG